MPRDDSLGLINSVCIESLGRVLMQLCSLRRFNPWILLWFNQVCCYGLTLDSALV